MTQTSLNRSPEEVAEIERHKYFLSEKAGCDIGWQAAEQDWDLNHAKQFRQPTDSKTEFRQPTDSKTEVRQSTNSKAEAQPAKGMSMFLKRLLPRR